MPGGMSSNQVMILVVRCVSLILFSSFVASYVRLRRMADRLIIPLVSARLIFDHPCLGLARESNTTLIDMSPPSTDPLLRRPNPDPHASYYPYIDDLPSDDSSYLLYSLTQPSGGGSSREITWQEL